MDRTLSDTLVVGCNDTARESTGGPAQAGAVDGGAATARLAVVVPAYQEVRTIQRALTRLLVALADSWPQVRVLVVSDGCTDGTASAVSALGDERISCVHYSPNRGKGHAIKTGAGLVDADYIAVIDADLDIDPVSLTWLLAELVASGADVVIGSKIHPQSVVHYPRVRRVLSGGYRLLVRTLFRLRVADTQTGVKVFRADALQAALTHVHVSGFAFDLNLLVALTDQGCAIREAPVKIDYQFTSTVPPTAALSMLRDTLAVAYRRAQRWRRRAPSARTGSHAPVIPPLRWGSLRRLLPLLGSVMLTVLGLLWLARFPVMQDDLQILTNGVAAIRADGVAHHFTANLITSVGPAHIVPFVTVPGTLHQLAATAAIALGVDPTVAWSMLRITWVVLALLAAAFFVTGWQQAGRTNRWGFTATYAGVAAVLLATVQVHVLWSNDPTVSYPIAGWAGCCAGFTLLGVVGRVLTGRLTLPIGAVLSGLLAILCLGTYELLAGFVVTGVLGVVLTRGAATARSRGWLTLALAAPLGMFAVGQVWRLTQPAVYSGTQPGEAGAVLPTAVWGVLSALPLTAAVPLDRIVGLRVPEPVGIASAAITVVMVMGLCAVWLRRRTPPRVSGPADDRVPGAPGGVAHLPPVSVLAAAAWVGCTLIIALSARYQQELGYLGAVYTFYAAGALAVAVIVVRGVQWLVEQGWASVARPATVAVVAATGLLTGMLNAVSADAIDGNWSFRYGREMLTALDTHPLPYRERCVIAQRWWLTPFPEYYRAEVLADAQRAFLAQHDTPMCAPADIFDGLAGTLSAVGATHGFEHDGQVGFQWLSPGRARLTVAPTPLTTAPTRVWLALDLPPCASRQRVRLVSPVRDRAQVFALPARVPLWVRPASVTEVDVETLAGGCQVPGDTRTLAARVSLAGAP